MSALTIKYLYQDVDRHGNVRRYFRRRLSPTRLVKIRLREKPGTEAFEREYSAAMRMHGVSLSSTTDAEKRPGTIYFVGFGPWVKIGFTTDLANRLATLQTACPETLIIHATFPGIAAYEKRLHQRFRDDRAIGEWFKMSRSMTVFLESVGHTIAETTEIAGNAHRREMRPTAQEMS